MASRAAILRAAQAAPGAAQRTPAPQGAGSPWIGQLPSYSADPAGYSYTYGPFLPRPPQTFTEGAFGPFSPILPVPVDKPPEGYERAQPRRWQPYVGYNLPVGQPGNEGYKLASFATLKTLSESYSILRTCLERRKNEIRALRWDIKLTSDAEKAYQGDRVAMRDFGERRAKAMKFFRRPDSDWDNFGSWLFALTEQLFTYDAVSIYHCPKKGTGLGRGLLGSDLDEMWLIDGSSIRPLAGLHGQRPKPPAPAYQQYEFGVPRADLTTITAGLDLDGSEGRLRALLRGDQLSYRPYLRRVDSPYGFSLVEQAIIPIMTGLRKQAYQLEFFTEGTVPRVYISPGDASMTPNQVRELQDALNAVAGDQSWAFKIQVLPPGSKVMPQKEMQIVDQADEWIASEVAMVCDINPMEIGLLPKVSTVASPFAAREMAQATRSIHERTATRPTLEFLAAIPDMVLQEICGQDDMQFVFEGMEQTQDLAAMTDMGVKQVQSGVKSIDEFRGDLHMPPWGLPETSGPVVFTQMGPIPLGQAATDTVSQQREALTGAHAAAQGATGRPRKMLPAGTSGQGRMNGSVTQRQARRGGALAPAHATAEGAPGHSGGKPAPKGAGFLPVLPDTESAPAAEAGMSRAAAAELEALGRHLGKGMDPGEWVPEHIPGAVMAIIADDLASGLSASYAVRAAAAALGKAGPQGGRARQRQAQAQRRQQQVAAQYQQQVQAALTQAVTQAQTLIAQWMAGTLAVTAAVLAGMIAALFQAALIVVLTALWTAAWNAAVRLLGADPADLAQALAAFLATAGEHWASVIAETGSDGLLAEIRAALLAGDVAEIIGRLEDIYGSAVRASMIADTEVNRAWNAGTLAEMRRQGIAWKQWRDRGDSRVCPACRRKTALGPWPLDKPYPDGLLVPPGHPRCRCWIEPAQAPAARKVLRREVGLNGQETWQEWEPGPDYSGGRTFQPHLADGTQVPQGGVPGASAGGEPPRWDGSEPWPVVERAPDADDDAAYGNASGTGARPGTYWPAPYMDGYWPSPHGHGSSQPPVSSPGAANGRPPNGVGKKARVSARLKGRSVPAKVVYEQLLENFPPSVLGWVHSATWRVCDVPMSMIDFADEDKWAASHQPGHVAFLAGRYERGEKVGLPVMADEPGNPHLIVADGRHRTLARRKLGKKTVRAYVATVSRRGGPWQRIYLRQKHTGSDPRNKSFTAGALGDGSAHGLTPFNLVTGTAPYCAGLLVRAADTGRVLLIQRALTDSDPFAGYWEIPGGHAEDGEPMLAAALREWAEECGMRPPAAPVTGRWSASNGIYEGFVMTVPSEDDIDLGGARDDVANPDGDMFEALAWHDTGHLGGNPAIRPELRADLPLMLAALDGGMGKSAQTPALSATHDPLGPHSLWHTPDRHVSERQSLPDYVEGVAHGLERAGHSESEAIAMAIAAVKEWAQGHAFGGKVKVTPEVQAAAREALRQWDDLKASHR